MFYLYFLYALGSINNRKEINMNFNFTENPEYQLNTSLVEEMIRLYGVQVKFLVTEKINKDDLVFGDHSHLKSDSSKSYYIYMLPETTEDWDSGNYGITNFGLVNFENITLFAAKSSFDPKPTDNVDDPHAIVGNLIVLPNNKVMEITNCDATVPGVNNLFTYNDAKSVYKLVCKPYDFKLINELDNVDVSVDNMPYETLDNYFTELIGEKTNQDAGAETDLVSTSVDTSTLINTKVQKPIVDKTEHSVWGEFE